MILFFFFLFKRKKKLLVHRNLPWKEARYVLATVNEQGVFSCQVSI